MNVKQMKEFLNNYPDEMEVFTAIENKGPHRNGVSIVRAKPVLTNIYSDPKNIRFMYDDYVSLRKVEEYIKISALLMEEETRCE